MNLKRRQNVSGPISCVFYVLYIAVHFFSNKMIACVRRFDFVQEIKRTRVTGRVPGRLLNDQMQLFKCV